MSYRLGWFSTGRDEAARELLKIVYENCRSGFISAEISFVFCNRERGEHAESDAFMDLVEQYRIPLVCFSSKKFKHDLWHEGKTDPVRMEQWRNGFDTEVFRRLKEFEQDINVLAGYMLIVSEMLCERFDMINLHPARPDGPKGSWQEVIWELIQDRADDTGVMMHLVTKELDRGPPLTYCSFPIRTDEFEPYLSELENKMGETGLQEIISREGEEEPYFKKVREEGVRRELPLIIFTLRTMAGGTVRIRSHELFEGDNKLVGGYDLTGEIEKYIGR